MDERAFERPAIYEIKVKGRLDARRSHRLADLRILPQPGDESLLIGPVADQAALYGLLSCMRNLGLVLISVNRVESHQGAQTLDEARSLNRTREVKAMCDYMTENDVAKWEMKRLEHEAARLCWAKRLGDEGTKRSLAGLAAFGPHILLNLGSALIAASERLSVNTKKGDKSWTLSPSK